MIKLFLLHAISFPSDKFGTKRKYFFEWIFSSGKKIRK